MFSMSRKKAIELHKCKLIYPENKALNLMIQILAHRMSEESSVKYLKSKAEQTTSSFHQISIWHPAICEAKRTNWYI